MSQEEGTASEESGEQQEEQETSLPPWSPAARAAAEQRFEQAIGEGEEEESSSEEESSEEEGDSIETKFNTMRPLYRKAQSDLQIAMRELRDSRERLEKQETELAELRGQVTQLAAVGQNGNNGQNGETRETPVEQTDAYARHYARGMQQIQEAVAADPERYANTPPKTLHQWAHDAALREAEQEIRITSAREESSSEISSLKDRLDKFESDHKTSSEKAAEQARLDRFNAALDEATGNNPGLAAYTTMFLNNQDLADPTWFNAERQIVTPLNEIVEQVRPVYRDKLAQEVKQFPEIAEEIGKQAVREYIARNKGKAAANLSGAGARSVGSSGKSGEEQGKQKPVNPLSDEYTKMVEDRLAEAASAAS